MNDFTGNGRQPGPNWRRAQLPVGATIQDAIRSLDRSTLQIVMIVDVEGVLVGTVTDGDIRRGLLRGLGMDSPVEAVMNQTPLMVPPLVGREAITQLMQVNRIRQLPVVDEARHVVGLHTWDAIPTIGPRDEPMVIMAGGKGTRLRPHTEHCPKPLLPVGGKPMLEHIIERAKGGGFHRFFIAVQYLGHMIEEFFGDGSKWHVDIQYVREETPLGTAGALALLDPRPTSPFVVTNGDVLTDIRYEELLDFHMRHGAAGTMAVQLYEWQQPFGVVHTDGVDIVGFDEKPISRSHINAGIYALNPSALDLLVDGEACDMPTLFTRLQEKKTRTIVYPIHEPWLDVGRDDDLKRARALTDNAD